MPLAYLQENLFFFHCLQIPSHLENLQVPADREAQGSVSPRARLAGDRQAVTEAHTPIPLGRCGTADRIHHSQGSVLRPDQ